MTERRLNHFSEKEKRFILIKTERLLNHIKAVMDGTGNPESHGVDFEIELNDLKMTYDNFTKYRGNDR